ncbi:MAG: YerC/YecD family TrpR-related protein [bacterium]
MSNWKTQKLKKLAQAFLSIKDEKVMIDFLRDLCTLEELEGISSRWEVVVLLGQGMSYRDIANKTGVSTTTVTRIAHWLNHGQGGYSKVLGSLEV